MTWRERFARLLKDAPEAPPRRYIAKPDTWFDAGTEATFICTVTPVSGLFSGIKGGQPDEDVCGYDEFWVVS